MPIYEYTCRDCRDDFELLIRGDEAPQCPTCHGADLERRWSVPAAHTAAGRSPLPICDTPNRGGCGLPQCGAGGCMGGL